MSTVAQVQANRANSLHSTGPRTAAGKAVVARNAVRHGLRAELSAQVEYRLMDGEDLPRFLALHESMCRQYRPRSEVEAMLVEQLAVCVWRQRRIGNLETQLYIQSDLDSPTELDVFLRRLNQLGRYQNLLVRQQRQITDELTRINKMRMACEQMALQHRRVAAMEAAMVDAMDDEVLDDEDIDDADDLDRDDLEDGEVEADELEDEYDDESSPAASSQAASAPNKANPQPVSPLPGQLIGRQASPGEIAVAAMLKQGK